MKIRTHLQLGRFFGAPIVIFAVLLGVALGGTWSWVSALVTIAAVLEMAYAHSFNTLLDFCWTGFDKGSEAERSKGKIYTSGQQVIASGMMTVREVLINGLAYLTLSAICILIVALNTSPLVWVFWAVSALCTFWYSWGKLHFQCELALGLGFGPLAVMMGMATQPNPDFWRAFLAGLPILMLWGYGAETMDQYTDAEPNWPRGLRNLGALVWKNKMSITTVIAFLLVASFLTQAFLISAGILSPLTAVTAVTIMPFLLCLIYLENQPKLGITYGLAGIYVYCLFLFLGQII
jgi:4-hydroxybenzoate polyprenyltransferase